MTPGMGPDHCGAGGARASPSAARAESDDCRPVRGVVTLQTGPFTAGGKPFSVLLVAGRGRSFRVQALQKPYTALMELAPEALAAGVVSDDKADDNMFRIMLINPSGRPMDAKDEVIVVKVRDRSLCDQWLQALMTAGVRVDVAGWAGTTASSPPKKSRAGSSAAAAVDGAAPPFRWLR